MQIKEKVMRKVDRNERLKKCIGEKYFPPHGSTKRFCRSNKLDYNATVQMINGFRSWSQEFIAVVKKDFQGVFND